MYQKFALPVELRGDPKLAVSKSMEDTASVLNLSFIPSADVSCEANELCAVLPFQAEPVSVEHSVNQFIHLEVDQASASKRLKNPFGKEIGGARNDFLLRGLDLYKLGEKPNSPEETKILNNLANLISKANHLSLPDEEMLALTTSDFNSVVSVIKKLARKVGLAELGAMVLLAIAVDDTYFLHKNGYKNEAHFFKTNADLMQISASCARDFATRGRIFLRYRLDILNGIEDIEGISLENLANTCLAKLTYYEKAVEKFGNKQALIYLKTLSFRDFKKVLLSEASKVRSSKKEKGQKESKQLEYDLLLKELGLMPNHKRLLKIKAKGGIPVTIPRYLTDYQVSLIESRYREHRIKTIRDNYESRWRRWDHYKPMSPDNPLKVDDLSFSNGVVFEKIVATREDYMEKVCWTPDEPRQRFENQIWDYGDIVLRIRAGISQIQPARRTIAVLLFKLVNERAFKGKWKKPRDGVEYKSFGDFAIEELGLRENYRDYLAVGKVLKEYHYFLDHLSDVDTEETFLKLRYLPDALKTHKFDEYLVLARLRSLSVREFKRFSIDPDFEMHFQKRLSKKGLDEFILFCQSTTNNYYGEKYNDNNIDFIEAYHEGDERLVQWIANKVVEETSIAIVPPAPMVDATHASEQLDEATNDGVNTGVDDSNQPLTVTVA
jgi:hypothetical protein